MLLSWEGVSTKDRVRLHGEDNSDMSFKNYSQSNEAVVTEYQKVFPQTYSIWVNDIKLQEMTLRQGGVYSMVVIKDDHGIPESISTNLQHLGQRHQVAGDDPSTGRRLFYGCDQRRQRNFHAAEAPADQGEQRPHALVNPPIHRHHLRRGDVIYHRLGILLLTGS